MSLHFVPLAACPPQPWRNGGGMTRELLAWPAAEGWLLRVSVARIDHSGRFSPFPGIQRCFTVLQGEGVTLDLPDGPTTLTPADEPLAFEGESAPMCHLLDGPTEDLNLMASRDAGRAFMQRATSGSSLDGPTRWRGLYAAGRALLDIDDRTEAIAAGTLAWSDDTDSTPWRLHDGSRCWWLALEN